MTMNDPEVPNAEFDPGHAAAVWLTRIIGAPRKSKAVGPVTLPDGFSYAAPQMLQMPLDIPREVAEADGGALDILEIRGLPMDMTLSSGERGDDGVWRIPPEQITGLYAALPAPLVEPVSLTLKGIFKGADSDEKWSELLGLDLGAKDAAAEISSNDEVRSAEKVDADSQTPAPALVAIDLDVSVGIEDPAALAKITVTFEGLPDGAALNVGKEVGQGIWLVSASDLNRLSIMLPEHTPAFDLTIAMAAEDGTTQSASIHVDTETSGNSDITPDVLIRLAPPTTPHPLRFKVFTDGNPAYDRIIDWSKGEDVPVDILVPDVLGARRPFEIVMRYEAIEPGMSGGPVLLGIIVNGIAVAPDSPLISARGHVDTTGRTWHGDLVINIRGLDMAPAADEPIFTDDMQEPTPEPVIEEVSATPQPAPEPEITATPQPIAPPVTEEPVLQPVVTVAPKPKPARRAEVLIVDASMDDLRSPAFLEELRGLRDFIRAHAEGAIDDVYDRLGVDVRKWREMEVRGPAGIVAEIDPLLPKLCAPGGIDNSRAIQQLIVPPSLRTPGVAVRIGGLAPGTMLSHGDNLGDGAWLVDAGDIAALSVLPPVRCATLASVKATWLGPDGNEQSTTSVLYGAWADALRPTATGMRSLELALDAETFDPDGHDGLSITIGDIPPGVLLERGTNHGGGVWTVDAVSGETLLFLVAQGTRKFKATLTCVAMDTTSGASTVVTRSIEATPSASNVGIAGTAAA